MRWPAWIALLFVACVAQQHEQQSRVDRLPPKTGPANQFSDTPDPFRDRRTVGRTAAARVVSPDRNCGAELFVGEAGCYVVGSRGYEAPPPRGHDGGAYWAREIEQPFEFAMACSETVVICERELPCTCSGDGQ